MQLHDLPLLSGARRFGGHQREINRDRLAFLRRLVGEVDGMARLSAPGVGALVVLDPERLHELLVEKPRIWEKGYLLRFALYPLAGEGLFTARMERWRPHRKLMAPLFQPAALERYGADMVACARRTLDTWRDGQELRLHDETTRITMSVAGKTLFGADTFGESDEIGRALTDALAWTSANSPSLLAITHIMARVRLQDWADAHEGWLAGAASRLAARLHGPLLLPGKKGRALREAVRLLDAYVERLIAARRADPGESHDLLTLLLGAHDDESGAGMDDKQVRDEILTLFVAGHETTATALAWSVYALCRNPAVYAALQAEVDALPGEPTVADLPRLPLARRVFLEALRVYPPVYLMARQAACDTELGGVRLAKHTVAVVPIYALHHHPALWPEPERFDPDRFLPEAEAARPRLAYLPFGAGPRVCLGNHFALMEAQLVLACLLRRARFALRGEDEPEPFATLRPRHGVRVRVTLRSPAAS